ncbi:MAG: isoprenylcysteine carboxylmethyltransferase family protein [Deltaproteobacteria bacterium]|nr:isoprenylcysteine carboxylmethyltransferase family protein [Deltaproteobacteria bacterium]MBW2498575.1 isoprenylcysteine carboxylmethyltransferase family protein [Deltaproteobacteria bacterium]
MARALTVTYGLLVYGLFFGTFCYLIGWTADIAVPRTINDGTRTTIGRALAINVGILSLFAVQHTVMARQAFKEWWTRFVPCSIERSTFVLFTVAILLLMIWQWQPLPEVVWRVESPMLAGLLWSLYGLGWVVVLVSTFIIDHFDLFGLKQTISFARGRLYQRPQFEERLFYRHVRHPLMLGFLIAFWAAPVMTRGRLLFALVTTAYVLVAIRIEERELVSLHGADYEQYRQRVPMLLPTGRREAN